MWEYNIGADYPSVCIDADPAEARITGWQCWQRKVIGYLNYGAGQWYFEPDVVLRPKTEDPVVWPPITGNGSPVIVYPGKDGVLPSVRFARFRDGMQDYDYLMLLQERNPDHPLLAEIRSSGRQYYGKAEQILLTRTALAKALMAEGQ